MLCFFTSFGVPPSPLPQASRWYPYYITIRRGRKAASCGHQHSAAFGSITRSPLWGRPKIYDAQFTSLGPKRCWCLMLNVIFHGMLPLRHDHKNGVNSLNHHTPKMCLWDYSHPQIVRWKKNNIPTNLMAIYLSIYIWGLLYCCMTSYDVW
jgi:hypothetical protein